MFGEYAVPIFVSAGTAASLSLVFLVPPLTTGQGGLTTTAQYEQDVRQERAYCSDNLDDVNCACFAGVASQILSNTKPQVPGANYAEPIELARSQAASSC